MSLPNPIRAASFGILAVMLAPACFRPPAEPSACDGLSEKSVAVTRDDYGDCAGEMIEELDGLELHLERFIRQNDKESGPIARKHAARLRHLMSQVGFQADVYRDMGSGELLQRWPDSSMHQFNSEVRSAATQFLAALQYPNEDNLRQGSDHYAKARQAYSRFRR